MKVYNWTDSFFFAARPHAAITFAGAAAFSIPEPTSAFAAETSLIVMSMRRR